MSLPRRSQRSRVRLEIERLEERCVPAVIQVANTDQLRQAILSSANFDIINMAAGTYFTGGNFIVADNQAKNLTIQAAPGATVAIDGSGGDIIRIRNPFGNPGTKIQFQKITFQNGVSGINGVSGGVTISEANTIFTDCTFINNRALNSTGGGAMTVNGAGVTYFNSCQFQGNSANTTGGAVEVQQGATLVVNTSLFKANFTNGPGHAPGTQAGAMHIGNSFVTIYNSRFESNATATIGGAISCQGVYDSPTPVDPLTNTKASLIVSNTSFVGNTATVDPNVPPPATPEGGAVVIEDSAFGKFTMCRFVDNLSTSGGAISIYRGIVEIDQSMFSNNRIPFPAGGGGGAIQVLSQSGPGSIHPPSKLTVTNSFFTGSPGGGVSALTGGAIYAGGDSNHLTGANGVPQGGTIESNQAQVVIDNVIFTGFVVQENAVPSSGNGGAIFVDLVNLKITNSVFMNNSAKAANPANSIAAGGAITTVGRTDMTITGTTFVNNTSDRTGGAILHKGRTFNVDNCDFLQNSVVFNQTIQADSLGAAIASIIDPGILVPTSISGTIQNSLFSLNNGMTLIEGSSAPSFGSIVNNLVYNNNQFFATTFGDLVFKSNLANAVNPAGLNNLVITNQNGTTSVKSTAKNNSSLPVAPIVAQLFAAPNRLYPFTTPFDGLPTTDVFEAFVISGVPNGILTTPAGGVQNVTGPAGFVEILQTGTFTLTAGGQIAQVTVIRPGLVVTGLDAGGIPNMNCFDGTTGDEVFTFLPYDPFFSGGVRVAVGDVSGDGTPDFITAAGPGGGPDIRIFNGQNGGLIRAFFAFNPLFTGGSFVSAGDLDGNGLADIVIGPDTGGGPTVAIFNGNGTFLHQFFAYDPGFTGGVRVAVGDINADGRNDIVCGAGPGGGPNVTVFSGLNLADRINSYFVYNPAFSAGIYVGAGDVNGDGFADVISGAGRGGGPNITVQSGKSITTGGPPEFIANFFGLPSGFTGGVRVGAVRSDPRGSNKAFILAAAGFSGGPNVAIIDGVTAQAIDSFFAYPLGFTQGLFVAGT